MEHDDLLQALVAAKAAQRASEDLVADIQAQLVKIAERDELKTIEGSTIRATVVTSERIVYNERLLKKALGAKLWNAIRTEKVDPSKLKKELTSGAIDPVIVAQHSMITKSKPYLRLSDAAQTQPQDS